MEITKPINLVDKKGNINFGWARKPMICANIEDSKFNKNFLSILSLKKWDFYYVTAKDFIFATVIVDTGLVVSAGSFFYDYKNNKLLEDKILSINKSITNFPPHPQKGTAYFKSGNNIYEFISQNNKKQVKVVQNNFKGKKLKAELTFNMPKDFDSMSVATPLKDKRFNFTTKINCMDVAGKIKIGDKLINVNSKKMLGGIDWTRGFLEYKTHWHWGVTSSFHKGDRIGFNFCEGVNDTQDTENAFFINGKITKVDKVFFKYNKKKLMDEWAISSNDGKINLKFIPKVKRHSLVNFLIIRSEFNQLFGYWEGELKTDDGKNYKVANLIGSVENHEARW